MIKKSIETTVLLVIAVFLPVVGNFEIYKTWPFWMIVAYGAALNMSQPKMGMKKEKKDAHDQYSMIFILVGAILCFAIPLADYAYGRPKKILLDQAGTILGLAMIWGGLLFRYWSIQILGRFFTSKVEIQSDHQLVETGPYRYLRHPSYTGAWISQVGISLILQSVIGLVFSIFIYFLIYIYRINCEEKALEETLGEVYTRYRKRTWKMFPLVY